MKTSNTKEGRSSGTASTDDLSEYVQAVGLVTAGVFPEMVVTPDDPIGMVRRVVKEVEVLREELCKERWQHAACLSIAEGVPGWDTEDAPNQSEAMKAVRRLRQQLA